MRIDRLNLILDFLQKLEDDAFNYEDFVAQSNDDNTCGTVCCLYGWMPKIDPSEFKWSKAYRGNNLYPLRAHGTEPSSASINFSEYLEIEEDDAHNLIYHAEAFFTAVRSPSNVTRRHMIALLQYIVNNNAFPAYNSLS